MKKGPLVHLPINNQLITPLQPVIFTGGPTTDAQHWHSRALSFFVENNTPAFIACPNFDIDRSLYHAITPPETGASSFPHQRAWEWYYSDIAAYENGVILLYVAPEQKSKHPSTMHHGYNTQFELGKWIGAKKTDPSINLIIGVHKDYAGRNNLLYDLSKDLPGFKVFDTLEECCQKAHDLVTEHYEHGRLFMKRGEVRNQSFEEMVDPDGFAQRLLCRRPQHLTNVQFGKDKPYFTFLEINPEGVTFVRSYDKEAKPETMTYAKFYSEVRFFSGLRYYCPKGYLEEVVESV